jgi:3-hydroxyisobutyrate dehydrogenase
MGYPMCTQLRKGLAASTQLHIYDLNTDVLKRFLHEHSDTFIGKSPKDVADKSDFIITILPEGSHVTTVYLSPETGILSSAKSNQIFVDCSTIDPASSKQVGIAVKQAGRGEFVDAPVSGGTIGAESGTLTFMIGTSADSKLYAQILPVLQTMGKNFFACGSPTLGLVTKLANNYLSGVNAIATSEAMNFAIMHGADPIILQRAISVSSGRNFINDVMNPVPGIHPNAPPSKGYQGGFKVQLMRKDIGLANAAAKEVGATMLLGDRVYQVFKEVEKDPGCVNRDNKVVYRFIDGKEDVIPGYFKIE